ncbi:MAG: hypothetical protein IJ561_03335 [Ruminococcus sp.]|nr:hypothetical protein [Ruminococcus sp.]
MLAEILHFSVMGVGDHILREAVTEIASSASGMQEKTKEMHKWRAFFAVFALLAMAAFFIQKHSMDDADLLGGKATIEKFMHSNVTAMVILLAAALGYIVVFFKTWKGMASSIYQLVFTFGALFIILFSGYSIFRSIHNINKDLQSPKEITVEEYVLCTYGKNYYVAFDQASTNDGILLAIPQEKFEELKGGKASSKGYLSRSYRLITEDEYTEYGDVQFYETPLTVSYYSYSVIYDNVEFKS